MKNIIKKITFVLSASVLLVTFAGASVTALAGTGPYRRISSKKGTAAKPYTYVETKIDLPMSSSVSEKTGTNDTAYVYLGGNGNGTEIDAGLQHSPTKGNWAPIILCKGKVSHPVDLERFRPGQTVTLKFYVPADNNLTLEVTGIAMSGVKKTIVTKVNNATGWKANGIGNVLKRVTSIGQKPENLNSGSYFKNVKWHDTYIGTRANYHKWLAGDSDKYIVYPNKTKVAVNFKNAGEETVNINLLK